MTYSGVLTTPSRLTIVINRRDRRSFLRSKKNPDERLASLDAVSPTRTLEQWWTMTKGKMGLSEAVDGQFVWYASLVACDHAIWILTIRMQCGVSGASRSIRGDKGVTLLACFSPGMLGEMVLGRPL